MPAFAGAIGKAGLAGRLFGILCLALARPAVADVALVQTAQAQNSPGTEGVLAKTLVEVSGARMRLVTGVARRAGEEKSAAEPWRRVQVLDLDTTTLWVLDPDAKTAERRALGPVLVGPTVPEPSEAFAVASASVTVADTPHLRKCAGGECSHKRVTARLVLRGKRGKRVRARLDQDVWLAPTGGASEKALLDLMAFESAYRRLARTSSSPLDQQTYRTAEAAAYLRVSRRDLEGVVARVREALAGVAGYPISSSVTWWREGAAAPKTKKQPSPKDEPKLLQDPPPAPPLERPPRPRFVPINWRHALGGLNRALKRAQSPFGGFPLGQLKPRPAPEGDDYERLLRDLTDAIRQLDEPVPPPPKEPEPATREKARAYEVFSEIADPLYVERIPDDHFRTPAGFRLK